MLNTLVLSTYLSNSEMEGGRYCMNLDLELAHQNKTVHATQWIIPALLPPHANIMLSNVSF